MLFDVFLVNKNDEKYFLDLVRKIRYERILLKIKIIIFLIEWKYKFMDVYIIEKCIEEI